MPEASRAKRWARYHGQSVLSQIGIQMTNKNAVTQLSNGILKKKQLLSRKQLSLRLDL